MAKSALAVQVSFNPDVEAVFGTLNRMVYQSARKRLLTTLCYALIDPRDQQVIEIVTIRYREDDIRDTLAAELAPAVQGAREDGEDGIQPGDQGNDEQQPGQPRVAQEKGHRPGRRRREWLYSQLRAEPAFPRARSARY